VFAFGAGCKSAASMGKPPATTSEPSAPAREEEEPVDEERGPVRVESLEGAEPPIFVLRGGDLGPGKLVFLHGMCGHGLGYAQSFQFAAARKGRLIAPQADVLCGDGPGAKWSQDVAALDARIVAAFRQLGHE